MPVHPGGARSAQGKAAGLIPRSQLEGGDCANCTAKADNSCQVTTWAQPPRFTTASNDEAGRTAREPTWGQTTRGTAGLVVRRLPRQ